MSVKPPRAATSLAIFALVVSACSSAATDDSNGEAPATIGSTAVRPVTTAPATSLPDVRSTTTTSRDAGQSPEPSPGTSPPAPRVKLSVVAENLGEPVAAVPVPDSPLLLVADRIGRLLTLDPADSETATVLDLSAETNTVGWERGLLGVALHPGFTENGRLFVSYTESESLSLVVAEFTSSREAGELDVDPTSKKVLLTVEQPGAFHQGGTLTFGPSGMLWIALGDGGGPEDDEGVVAQDPFGNGQDPMSLQGTVLRIDVDTGDPYAIPPGNPFADGVGGAPEVWAYGLRNPWGLAVENDLLFVPDVGHVEWEELNILPLGESSGANFGWSLWEGPSCFEDRPCEDVEATMPELAFDRSQICAIIGGRIYRGSAIPEMRGQYLFADLCSGWVRGLILDGATAVDQVVWIDAADSYPQVTAFATDNADELYLLTFGGLVLKLDPVR